MGPSDEDLCARIAERDPQAFDLIVERHQARAYRLACSMLGNEADARDVSQEAFLRLYEAAHSFDRRARFSTWFYRILVNLCIDHQRRNRWWRKVVPLSGPDDDPDAVQPDPPSTEPGPLDKVLLRQSVERLNGALGGLSAHQRTAVLLQAQQGFTSKEIAAVLNCSENTARVHLHRAISHLRKVLKDE